MGGGNKNEANPSWYLRCLIRVDKTPSQARGDLDHAALGPQISDENVLGILGCRLFLGMFGFKGETNHPWSLHFLNKPEYPCMSRYVPILPGEGAGNTEAFLRYLPFGSHGSK